MSGVEGFGDMRNTPARHLTAFAVSALVAAFLFVLVPGAAYALTLTATPDVTATVDVTVAIAAKDGSGTVMLVRDGTVVAELPSEGASAVVFADVPVAPGAHRFRASMRSSTAGFIRSWPWVTVMAWGAPGAPTWVAPAGGLASSPCDVRVYAGASTSSMTLSVNGAAAGTVACTPGQHVSFGQVTLPKGSSTFVVVASNPFGEVATFTVSAKRVEWPYATCIVVDKSDYKLYWVRNGQLVKAYPIAHGKGNCTPVATWKVLAKYTPDPHGIYGPRKMRLFRKQGSKYVYTAYGIHGTNQPWVIGTMASHGCIRMYNSDILELWPQVPLGTMVITRP